MRMLESRFRIRVLDAVLELAAELVPPDTRQIVTLIVEEERLDELVGVFGILGLTRPKLLVDLFERVFARLDIAIFFDRIANDRDALRREILEKRKDRVVALPVVAELRPRERADERRDVDLAVLVDPDADRPLGLVVLGAVVGFELDPGAAIWDDRRVVRRPGVRIDVLVVVNAGRAYELADDHALGAVDHKRALVGHEREIAHEDLLVGDAFDFARFGRDQTNAHPQRRAVGHVALAALLDRVLRLAQRVLAELENQVTGKVLDRGYRGKRLGEAFGLEPIEAGLLQLDEVGDLEDVRNLREGVTLALGSRLRPLFDRESAGGHRERRGHDGRAPLPSVVF